MNYGRLIGDAFRITWRNRYLWFFGFFAGLGSSSGGGGGGGNGGGFDEQGSTEIASVSTAAVQSTSQNVALIVGLIVAAVLVFVVFFVIYVISQGGLPDSVAAVERGEGRRFSSTWRAGTGLFWRVLGHILLFFGIVVGLLLVVGIPLVLLILGAFTTDSIPFQVLAVIFAVLVGFLLLLVVLVPVAIVRQFARRALVVGGDGVIRSVGSGYRMFRRNIGRSLLVWLVQLGVMVAATVAFIIAVLVVGFVLFLPAIALAVAEYVPAAVVAGVVAGIVLVPLLIVGSAFLGTFNHSYWTLAYLRMDGPPTPIGDEVPA